MTDREIITINNKTIINKTFFLRASLFMLFLCAALRLEIGSDYLLYQSIYNSSYEKYLSMGWVYTFESEFFRFLGLSFQYFIAFNSFIFMLGIYILLKKFSNYKYISLLAFLGSYAYFSSFNGFRQYSSISLVIISLILFYDKNKKITAILIFLISLGIHKSSIMFLPLYLFYIIKIRHKNYIIILFICLFSFFLIPDSLKDLLFVKILNLDSFFLDKYSDTESITGLGRSVFNKIFFLFYWLATFIYVIYKYKEKKKLDWIDYIYLVFFIINGFLPFSNIVKRMSYLYEIFSLVIFSRLLTQKFSITTKNVFKIIIFSVFLVRLISTLMNNGDGVVPYKNIFYH
ncbi:EpsG family protein [Gottfriedia sp. NPDC057948]|uniref:EpsG family protein n=1 Tax=Gottfriedia sp. NPDC057948 TaxID=3346287 RepID=UPI0036D8A88A